MAPGDGPLPAATPVSGGWIPPLPLRPVSSRGGPVVRFLIVPSGSV